MAKSENVKGWITVNGTHIPIMEGQSKQEAYEKAFAAKRKVSKENQKLKPYRKPEKEVNIFKEASIEMQDGYPIGLKNVRLDSNKIYSPDYPDMIANVDPARTRLEKGDGFGLRMLGTYNTNVYGRVEKITSTSITITHPSGTKYVVSTKDCELSIGSGELRMWPKDKNTTSWFGFMRLDRDTAKEFEEKAKNVLKKK